MQRPTVNKQQPADIPGILSEVAGSLPIGVSDIIPDLFQWTGFLLSHINEIARRAYEARINLLRLKPHQVGILQLLKAKGSMVQARLGDRLGVDKAIIVPHLNHLENEGLVERRNHPDDARSFVIHLLPAGEARLRDAQATSQSCFDEVFQVLTPDEKDQLHGLLSKVAGSHALVNSNF